LGEGIDRVIVGTKALDENFLAQVVETFGDQLAVSLDVKDGRVQTRGWLECADQTLTEVLAGLNRFQLDTLVYTDTQKDGMLRGPNLAEFGKVLEMTRSKVILAGGISGLNDIRQCRQMVNGNFDGVIVGKALFQDDFSLTEALRIANQQEDLR
jgi:phosphoribosylformimino-5-aminoimidazole carboxamide ribotide isomerase